MDQNINEPFLFSMLLLKKSDNHILLQTCEKCDLLIEVVVINETESAFRAHSAVGLFQAPRL